MPAPSPFRSILVAPCGMDCAICTAYLREKRRCEGCSSAKRQASRHCTITSCGQIRGRYRHSCDDYPCRRLSQLDRRYRKRYGMSMLENLQAIREQGIREFVRGERERWTCRSCGGTIDVHQGACSSCGKERER